MLHKNEWTELALLDLDDGAAIIFLKAATCPAGVMDVSCYLVTRMVFWFSLIIYVDGKYPHLCRMEASVNR